MNKIGSVVFLSLLLLKLTPACAHTTAELQKVKSGQVNTAYFNLVVDEYRFSRIPRGRGGAIAVVGDYLVVGSGDNRFIRINPANLQAQEDFLPALVTGEEDLPRTRRYRYREIVPRVEDLVYDRGTYYVTYTRYDESHDLIHFVIAKFGPGQQQWETLWESVGLEAPYFPMGSGGRMAIKEGKLYFSVGDFSLDHLNGLASDVAPQNAQLPWGKVSYIDLKDKSYHRFTLGHRNPQGLLFLKDGRLLASEQGPQGGDELNILKKGQNYGWPYRSYGTIYGSFKEYGARLPLPPANVQFTEPIHAFVPSPAIGQLAQIAAFHPKWDGDILLASLKAQSFFHIRLDKDRVVYVEPILINHRIRDFKQVGKAIYVLTDAGAILRMSIVQAD